MREYMIAAGKRNKLVQIQQGTPGVGTSGRPVTTWTSLGSPVYMSRLDGAADERFAAAQDTAWGRAEWYMPYQANMDPELVDVPGRRRLSYNGRIFDIQAATLMERRIGIELITLAKADAV